MLPQWLSKHTESLDMVLRQPYLDVDRGAGLCVVCLRHRVATVLTSESKQTQCHYCSICIFNRMRRTLLTSLKNRLRYLLRLQFVLKNSIERLKYFPYLLALLDRKQDANDIGQCLFT